MALLQVAALTKINEKKIAVNAISFEQQSLQKIAIAGETGSGKSTLLKMIAGLAQPDAGTIYFNHTVVVGPLDQLIPGHPQIAYHSQHFELRNNYWVHELLEMAQKTNDAEAQQIFRVCDIVHLLNRRTNELSGGEKQRIVLAMQLVKKPILLLLDEPFSNLDSIHTRKIKEVIAAISNQLQISCILVSHDGADILSWADEIIVMKEGRIIQQGSPLQIFEQPINEYCAGLFGEYNIIGKKLAAQFQIKETEKSVLLRPTAFTVQSKTHAIHAIVHGVFYFGTYYLLHVKVGEKLLKIQTENKYVVGDVIFISVIADKFSLI